MFGIAIAILIGLISYIFSAKAPEAIWITSTTFLFVWYVVWAFIPAIFALLAMLGVVGSTTPVTAFTGYGAASKLLRGLFGFVGSAAVSSLMYVWFFMSTGLKIGGAYLLSTAVTLTERGHVWNTTTLILGALALIMGFVVRRKYRVSLRQNPDHTGTRS